MYLSDMMDVYALKRLVNDGYIKMQRDPSGHLEIYNYTAKAQYERLWTPETTQCRGLIVNTYTYRIEARPFPKFFNVGEEDPADSRWKSPYTVHEKMDGSLGILYFTHTGEGRIATRGSFTSEQAEWATQHWRDNYSHLDEVLLGDNLTYLFEIIYAQNRIVVDYGDDALVFLACIDTETGRDYDDFLDWTGPRAKEFNTPNIPPHRIKDFLMETGQISDDGDFEGVVLKFDVGEDTPHWRVKIKLDEYVRLHRILTQCTARTIWEMLKNGEEVLTILNDVPDEFYEWVRATVTKLNQQFDNVLEEVRDGYAYAARCAYHEDVGTPEYRKKFARAAQHTTYPSLVFAHLDGKELRPRIWDIIRPAHEVPFTGDDS